MSPSYNVFELSSLFSVCALALSASDERADNIADRLRQEIKHTLELGARLAGTAGIEVSIVGAMTQKK
ncbi:MAG: hypothetical protein KF874_14600 [Rhizobiaceae bacterium]|nr:hypothetical protein [Rhizobiaceae bacterium]